MDSQKPEVIAKKISKHEFYFETPLYEVIEIDKLDNGLFRDDVDAYSAKNGIDTTYKISERSMGNQYESIFENFYKVTLTCKRKDNDVLIFFIFYDENNVIKVGQDPSLADIQFAEIGKKYDKYLSRDELKEFKRAIGLAAYGVGVGSFVYLRRIFENLIYQAFNENEKEIGITKGEFSLKGMEDKVNLLKSYLPNQLVAMKNIYFILSKGIHELNEQICLKYFPAMKLSIELVLEQKIDMEVQRKRDQEVKKQIENISKEIEQ